MAKTDIDKEVKERQDYFADWVERLGTDKEAEMVVNEKTAKEFIKNSLSKDNSLQNLVEAMESTGKGLKTLVETSYIQNLISENTLGEKIDKAVVKLKKKRESLEKAIPKKQVVTRRKVINKFTNATVLKKYGVNKDKNNRYHDSKTGRFVGFDKVLRITDLVILSSAKKRKEYDEFIKKIKK